MATRAIPMAQMYTETVISDLQAFVPGQVGIANSAILHLDGVNSNVTPANPNQAMGVFVVPSGTASGATITVANTRCTGLDYIYLTSKSYSGKNLSFDTFAFTAGVGFTLIVRTHDGNATTQDCDVQYWLVN